MTGIAPEAQVVIPGLREIVIFLVAAAIIAPVFHRFRISPVLGFLFAGVLIGPHGLGEVVGETGWFRHFVITDIEGVSILGELGVVFLLFTIGLELSLDRLWALRRFVFGLGTAQVLVSTLVIGAVAFLFENGRGGAIIIGVCLALSSTAIVMQLLTERRELGTTLGRGSFAILLMQDLAVVPILFLIGALGSGEDGEEIALALPIALLRAALVLAAIYIAGKLFLRPLFRLSSQTRSPELFVAAVLLTIILAASATQAFGLSMGLGAFLAGMLLAETEYRHQIEVDIGPFKGLLLGVFFLSVGMSIEYRLVAGDLFWVALSVTGLYAVKALIIAGLALLYRLPKAVAIEMGLLLGAGGEFAFVIIGAATAAGQMPAATGQFMVVVAAISMFLTPFAAKLAQALARRIGRRDGDAHAVAELVGLSEMHDHVLIAGFGRVGRTVAKLLEEEDVPYVGLDADTEIVAKARAEGLPVYVGNASRLEILQRAHVKTALAFVVTVDDVKASGEIVRRARAEAPGVPIVARARDAEHGARLLASGASIAIPEIVEASLQLGGRVLEVIGVPHDLVARRIAEHRPVESAIPIADDGMPASEGEPRQDIDDP